LLNPKERAVVRLRECMLNSAEGHYDD
jgi:hypothetical protein